MNGYYPSPGICMIVLVGARVFFVSRVVVRMVLKDHCYLMVLQYTVALPTDKLQISLTALSAEFAEFPFMHSKKKSKKNHKNNHKKNHKKKSKKKNRKNFHDQSERRYEASS